MARILQSNLYRFGVKKYKIDPDEAVHAPPIPEDAVFDVYHGLEIGVPAHKWVFRARKDGTFGIFSGGFYAPSPFQIKPGAKDGLITLTEDDRVVITGDLEFPGQARVRLIRSDEYDFPTPEEGEVRYNVDTRRPEFWNGVKWMVLS